MKQIDVLNLKIQKFIDVLLCIASIVMLAVNLAQVIFRIIFFSLYAACRERNELNIAVISFKDPKKTAVLNMIREICSLLTCLALLVGSILMIQNALAYPQKTASLKIITGYLYFCMPISFVLLSWVKLINIVHDIQTIVGKTYDGGEAE